MLNPPRPDDRIFPPGAEPFSRRDVLKAALALPLVGALAPRTFTRTRRAAPHVAVVGSGAFGGWTALHLLRGGARVTLLDAWGAGNSRASSGGETRVIRGVYGARPLYIDLVTRAFALWRENEARFKRRLYHRTGALWMFQGDDAYARGAMPYLTKAGLAVRELSVAEASRRWPQIDFDGVRTIFHEEEAGYLTARQACETVRESFVAEGGEYRTAQATPGGIAAGEMGSLALGDGTTVRADRFVFACGPWLGRVFPDVIGNLIRATRQEVFYFGVPAGDSRFDETACPVWVDFADRLFYGIPGNERRGFKVADDTHGAPIDPTDVERLPSAEALARARQVMAARFPALAKGPLVESRVCQYENSPDGDFIIDRHPAASNVWLAGGGSGHGFKMGPAIGEHVAALVLGTVNVQPAFALARFSSPERTRTPTPRPAEGKSA
jgi:glycine/D-amino acid oxidase-like deaminating enzyme